MIYLDKVPTGIKASIFLYYIQQQNKKLQNPAFIMILSALNLNEQSVMNTYAKHAIKSAIATTAKIKSPTKQPTSVDSTNRPSSSSKTVKKRRGTKSISLQQRGKKEDYQEDSDSYGTPYYDSDTPATVVTETTKTKRWQTYTS